MMAELTTKGAKILFFLGLLLAIVLGMAGIGWAVEVGEKAPNFTLTSTTGKAISEPILLQLVFPCYIWEGGP